MSAEIIILPHVRVERSEPPAGSVMVLHLHPRDLARLRRRATEWNMTEVETAEALLSQALDPRVLK